MLTAAAKVDAWPSIIQESLYRLIVLDGGEIVEQGTHQELVKSDGIYSQLWAHQTGGFLGLD